MTDIINEEENTTPLPEEEQETVVVDNGQTYESQESAIIAKEEADKAKLWAQESERQANLASGSADTAAQARDEAVNIVNGFTQRVTEATNTFNSNATAKTNDFNNNATAKTTAFNDNYTEKKALIDAQVAIAESSATNANNYKNKAREWAVSQNIVDNEDYSAKYWAEKAEEWAESVGNPANKDLSNLSAQGQNIANWSTNVTNCITEIPQDIKLELSNGTLTLKAGSKVYIPNGFESDGTTPKFDVVIIDTDKTRDWTYSEQGLMFYIHDTNMIHQVPLNSIYSGTTAPTGTLPAPTCWYDTTNNKVKVTSDSGATWIDTYSLPLCLLAANGTQITSIDQVFNGFGYIGSTIFVLPGVKGLIPDGRNKDGTLKNIEFTTSSVLTSTQAFTGWNGKWSLYLNTSSIRYHPTELEYISDTKPTGVYTTTAYWYSPLDNKLYFTRDTGATWTQSDELHCVDYTENSSKITSITPKTVFRIADDNIIVHKTGDEIISGTKTFIGIQYLSPQTLITKENNSDEGGQITFEKATNSTLKGNPYIDVYQDTMRFITIDRNNNVQLPLTINCNDGTFTSGTFQVVSTLPASPNSNVFYFIPE